MTYIPLQKIQNGERSRSVKPTHHVEETIVHAIQVGFNRLEEGSGSIDKILEDGVAVYAIQM